VTKAVILKYLSGWGDVEWNNKLSHSPHLSYLAKTGTILSHHYAHPVCSPSRAAFMTGYYASKTTMQDPVWEDNPIGLNPEFKLMPAFLRDLGYKTYAVGK